MEQPYFATKVGSEIVDDEEPKIEKPKGLIHFYCNGCRHYTNSQESDQPNKFYKKHLFAGHRTNIWKD